MRDLFTFSWNTGFSLKKSLGAVLGALFGLFIFGQAAEAANPLELNFWLCRIHETAFRPWQSDNIPRRYCSGDVMLSDGKMHVVHFSIIEDGGFAGYNQSVEWCVTGLDRNWAYNPGCRAAQP
jgi:hypothetical protein